MKNLHHEKPLPSFLKIATGQQHPTKNIEIVMVEGIDMQDIFVCPVKSVGLH